MPSESTNVAYICPERSFNKSPFQPSSPTVEKFQPVSSLRSRSQSTLSSPQHLETPPPPRFSSSPVSTVSSALSDSRRKHILSEGDSNVPMHSSGYKRLRIEGRSQSNAPQHFGTVDSDSLPLSTRDHLRQSEQYPGPTHDGTSTSRRTVAKSLLDAHTIEGIDGQSWMGGEVSSPYDDSPSRRWQSIAGSSRQDHSHPLTRAPEPRAAGSSRPQAIRAVIDSAHRTMPPPANSRAPAIESSPVLSFSSSPIPSIAGGNNTLPSPFQSYSTSIRDSNVRQETKLKSLERLLEQIKPCSACWFHNRNPESDHTAFRCPEFGELLGASFNAFKKAMVFPKVVKTCYLCVVPPSIPSGHPNGLRAGCNFDDIIKPLAYLIYEETETRKAVLGQLGLHGNHFHDLRAYAGWMAQPGHTIGSLNALEVILALGRLKGVA
jgi:hypothetical protein